MYLLIRNYIEPLEWMKGTHFFSVKKNCLDEGNVYHRKLLERRLTVGVWRHGESVTTERIMINQPQSVMWNRDIHYALSSINYAADGNRLIIFIVFSPKNASWIIPFVVNVCYMGNEILHLFKYCDALEL